MNDVEKEIVAFLESQNYEVQLNDDNEVSFVIYTVFFETLVGNDRNEALKLGLSHFLIRELGRKWDSTYEYLEQFPPAFSKDEERAIKRAIELRGKL